MKSIQKISLDDNLNTYRLFFPDEPTILAVKHEFHSVILYYDVNDMNFPESELKEFEVISCNVGIHLRTDYKYIGNYEYNGILYFLYMKQL